MTTKATKDERCIMYPELMSAIPAYIDVLLTQARAFADMEHQDIFEELMDDFRQIHRTYTWLMRDDRNKYKNAQERADAKRRPRGDEGEYEGSKLF